MSYLITCQNDYKGYENVLAYLDLEQLSERREDLSLNFAKKAIQSEKYSNWFIPNEDVVNTRSDKNALIPVKTRTVRYKKSPLPYLTKLLNDNWKTN